MGDPSAGADLAPRRQQANRNDNAVPSTRTNNAPAAQRTANVPAPPEQALALGIAGLPAIEAAQGQWTELRAAWEPLRTAMAQGDDAVGTAKALLPAAHAMVDVLPKLHDKTSRHNAMRWLEAFLSVGRKSGDAAKRLESLDVQRPVWQKLVSALPDLRGDRTSQFAIVHRLHREMQPGKRMSEAQLAQMRAAMQPVVSALTPMLGSIGENCVDIARSLVGPAGSAGTGVPKGRSGAMDAVIASLPPLSQEEATQYVQHMDHLMGKIIEARSGAMSPELTTALVYSMNKHLPGLNAMLVDYPGDIAGVINALPGMSDPANPLFVLSAREGDHSNAIIVRSGKAGGDKKLVDMWVLDTVSTKYENPMAYEVNRLQAGLERQGDVDVKCLMSSIGLREDGASCLIMAAEFIAKSFRNYDDTVRTLDQLRSDPAAFQPMRHPGHDGMVLLRPPRATAGLSAEHLKYTQDKDDIGRLDAMTKADPRLGKTIVNKRGLDIAERYREPANLKEVENSRGERQLHSRAADNAQQKWGLRAYMDLQLLRSQPDGGAAAWREACVRMAPVRLDDDQVTDRFVGLSNHPAEKGEHDRLTATSRLRYDELTKRNAKLRGEFEKHRDLAQPIEKDDWYRETALQDAAPKEEMPPQRSDRLHDDDDMADLLISDDLVDDADMQNP